MPILAGAPVQVQQQGLDLNWTTIATGTTGPDGSFSVPVSLVTGSTYRVLVAPGHGYSPGATAPLDRDRLMRRLLPMLAVAALVAAAPAAAFVPTDPLASKQWYLDEDHAFDAWPTPPTALAPVKVAVVDSGIDGTLPDFAGRIAAAESFVGGSPLVDTEGHGTFVAGEIAANLDTQGIVGMAYSAQLLIAKVVTPDGRIPLNAEAAAIRWAVDNGARVINLSLGGVRDPAHPNRDTYSSLEASAVAYAYAKGAVLVAAVGNADEAYSEPWPYASYPAALPHVIGVSALTRSGNVADFSDRDAVFNDIAAPGAGIFSTFPAAITAAPPDVHRPGLLRLRPGGLRERGGHVVLDAAGVGGGGDALRGRSDADEQPGRRRSSSTPPTT